MNQTQIAMLRVAKACTAEAQRADWLGQRSYASELRGSARRALAEFDAITPAPVNPETAAARERARAFAQVVLAGFGQTRH